MGTGHVTRRARRRARPLAARGAQVARGRHLHGAAEQPLQALLQGREVEQRPSRLELDQEVDIAVRALLAARHRAEHAHVACAARGGCGADLGAEVEEAVEQGHGVRVGYDRSYTVFGR
jgi:hypothetical protein